jgi:hypothetical protein
MHKQTEKRLLRSLHRICILMISASLCCSIFVSKVIALAPYLSVQPYYPTVGGPDTTFSLDIVATYVSNLYGWEIKLYYDSTVLRCVTITEGPLLQTGGDTFFIRGINNDYNETHGRIIAACFLLGNVPGVSINGVIATVTFETKQVGLSTVELKDTKLSDPDSSPIPHIDYDALVEVVQIERNVAVTKVTAALTEAFAGQLVNVYVEVANEGKKTETFNVTAYCNDTVIGTQTVTNLLQGSNTTLLFSWNTAGTSAGESYIVKATAQTLAGETNLDDNTLVDGTVRMLSGIHDVAIESVSVSVSEAHEGQEVDLSVRVRNKGNFTETSIVTTYFGATPISSKTVNSLAPASEQDLTFTWNTTGFPLNTSLVVIANASAVLGEANLADNVLQGGTLKILPHAAPSITIVEVIPCNQAGEPASYFRAGGLAYFKVTINATIEEPRMVLVTVNVFDADQTAIGLVRIQGPIVQGTSFFISGLTIPQTAHLGTSSVYANIFNDWPHKGGVPYCPQKSASFEIRGG